MTIVKRINSILDLHESTDQGYCELHKLWTWTSCLT